MSPEAYSEPIQTSKTVRFAKLINGFYPLFAKRSILDVCQGSEYASGANLTQQSYTTNLLVSHN